jgi:hypothetical protein
MSSTRLALYYIICLYIILHNLYLHYIIFLIKTFNMYKERSCWRRIPRLWNARLHRSKKYSSGDIIRRSLQELNERSALILLTGERCSWQLLGIETIRTLLWIILANRQRSWTSLVLAGELAAESREILKNTSRCHISLRKRHETDNQRLHQSCDCAQIRTSLKNLMKSPDLRRPPNVTLSSSFMMQRLFSQRDTSFSLFLSLAPSTEVTAAPSRFI